MILSAVGIDASIELFEHHLVITRRRPGLLTDRPSAERFIPLSSIKSIGFVPPGLLSSGWIVMSLEGAASSTAGTIKDENAVRFGKRQLPEFERLLHAIREAIATPSIERLAMAAQQRQRLYSSQSSGGDERSIQALSQQNAQGGWTGGPDDRTVHHEPQSGRAEYEDQTTPVHLSRGGLWRDMPLMGKAILVAFVVVLLLSMCSSGTSSPDNPASPASSDAGAAAEPAQAEAQAVLSDLTEFITGKPGSVDIAVTDGPGSVGEFCSATTGTTIMSFGGTKLDGKSTGVFDYFYAYKGSDGGTSTSGTFSFDRTAQQIIVRSVTRSKSGSEAQTSLPDLTMAIRQIEPGTVLIDGVTYHTCVI